MTSPIEQGRTPERGDVLLMDPTVLMEHNPAALIVHKESYDRMAASFEPDLFQLPHVVKVRAFSSEGREMIRYLVVDGMTRIKYVADNQEEIARKHPDFRFRVQDVTTAYLRNPRVVPPEETTEDQQALTMVQYLHAVVPFTAEHSQIVSDRIAAHLINGWNNMIGPDLSRKYSALAALSLLGNQAINIATEDGLRRDLDRQPRLMENETRDERDRLSQSLREVAAVIRESRINNRQEVVRSAYMLVGTESAVIGGETEARRQIYGLVYIPEVEMKLKEAYETMGERAQMRGELRDFLLESYRKAGRVQNRQDALSVLGEALRNPLLNYDHTLDVITSPNPIVRYTEVRQEVNKDRLTKAYVAPDRIEPLSVVESQLIEKFGGRTNLPEDQIERLTQGIRMADMAIKRADELKTQITTNRDQLLEQGVSGEVLDQAMSNIQRDQEALNNANTPQTLNTNAKRFNNTLSDITRRISNQITLHKVGGMVDEAGGDKLKEGYGPRARNDIRDLVFGEFVEITEGNQARVQQRIQDFLSLDDDLLRRVKDSDISLRRALEIQGEERGQVSTKPTAPPTVPLPTGTDRTSTVRSRTPTIKPPAGPTLPPDGIVMDARQLEERRKQVNREKFKRWMEEGGRLFNDIDLQPEELTDVEKEEFDSFIRPITRLGLDHPDVPRVIRRDYPQLLEENIRMREELLRRQREDADRDSRTGR